MSFSQTALYVHYLPH